MDQVKGKEASSESKRSVRKPYPKGAMLITLGICLMQVLLTKWSCLSGSIFLNIVIMALTHQGIQDERNS